MRAAIRLLTLLCLLWCGVHVAEPAAAHGGPVAEHQAVDVGRIIPGDPRSSDGGLEQGTHAAHHHCPIAPDQRLAGAPAVPNPAAATPVAPHAAALASLTRAPPLQPPAA